jgi:hypothetical protein
MPRGMSFDGSRMASAESLKRLDPVTWIPKPLDVPWTGHGSKLDEVRESTAALIRHVLANSTREHIEPKDLDALAAAWEACYEVVRDGNDHPKLAAFRDLYRRVMGHPSDWSPLHIEGGTAP